MVRCGTPVENHLTVICTYTYNLLQADLSHDYNVDLLVVKVVVYPRWIKVKRSSSRLLSCLLLLLFFRRSSKSGQILIDRFWSIDALWRMWQRLGREEDPEVRHRWLVCPAFHCHGTYERPTDRRSANPP